MPAAIHALSSTMADDPEDSAFDEADALADAQPGDTITRARQLRLTLLQSQFNELEEDYMRFQANMVRGSDYKALVFDDPDSGDDGNVHSTAVRRAIAAKWKAAAKAHMAADAVAKAVDNNRAIGRGAAGSTQGTKDNSKKDSEKENKGKKKWEPPKWQGNTAQKTNYFGAGYDPTTTSSWDDFFPAAKKQQEEPSIKPKAAAAKAAATKPSTTESPAEAKAAAKPKKKWTPPPWQAEQPDPHKITNPFGSNYDPRAAGSLDDFFPKAKPKEEDSSDTKPKPRPPARQLQHQDSSELVAMIPSVTTPQQPGKKYPAAWGGNKEAPSPIKEKPQDASPKDTSSKASAAPIAKPWTKPKPKPSPEIVAAHKAALAAGGAKKDWDVEIKVPDHPPPPPRPTDNSSSSSAKNNIKVEGKAPKQRAASDAGGSGPHPPMGRPPANARPGSARTSDASSPTGSSGSGAAGKAAAGATGASPAKEVTVDHSDIARLAELEEKEALEAAISGMTSAQLNHSSSSIDALESGPPIGAPKPLAPNQPVTSVTDVGRDGSAVQKSGPSMLDKIQALRKGKPTLLATIPEPSSLLSTGLEDEHPGAQPSNTSHSVSPERLRQLQALRSRRTPTLTGHSTPDAPAPALSVSPNKDDVSAPAARSLWRSNTLDRVPRPTDDDGSVRRGEPRRSDPSGTNLSPTKSTPSDPGPALKRTTTLVRNGVELEAPLVSGSSFAPVRTPPPPPEQQQQREPQQSRSNTQSPQSATNATGLPPSHTLSGAPYPPTFNRDPPPEDEYPRRGRWQYVPQYPDASSEYSRQRAQYYVSAQPPDHYHAYPAQYASDPHAYRQPPPPSYPAPSRTQLLESIDTDLDIQHAAQRSDGEYVYIYDDIEDPTLYRPPAQLYTAGPPPTYDYHHAPPPQHALYRPPPASMQRLRTAEVTEIRYYRDEYGRRATPPRHPPYGDYGPYPPTREYTRPPPLPPPVPEQRREPSPPRARAYQSRAKEMYEPSPELPDYLRSNSKMTTGWSGPPGSRDGRLASYTDVYSNRAPRGNSASDPGEARRARLATHDEYALGPALDAYRPVAVAANR